MATEKLLIRTGETTQTVEVLDGDASAVAVRVEGGTEPLHVEALQPGTYRVTDGDRNWVVFVAGTRDACWVFLDGEVFTVEVTSGTARRRSAVSPHEALSAPMPATVVKILVAPGEAVQKGQTLIVLEAMKMELPVRAPGDGTIDTITCREGDLVQPGAALLEFK